MRLQGGKSHERFRKFPCRKLWRAPRWHMYSFCTVFSNSLQSYNSLQAPSARVYLVWRRVREIFIGADLEASQDIFSKN